MSSKLAEHQSAVTRARIARGHSQTELARRAGISRQALNAIEAGAYQPGVTAAIAIARELGQSVEGLFSAPAPERLDVIVAGSTPPSSLAPRSRIALARLGGRIVAIAQPPVAIQLSAAGGIVEKTSGSHAVVDSFRSQAEIDSTLVIAGCDPAVAILAEWLARTRSNVRVAALGGSSRSALKALAGGAVHAAGAHLRDPRTGDYNLSPARRVLGRTRCLMVNFARWELGLATRPGNPLGIKGLSDLMRPRIRIVNRELGSGARIVLDEALHDSNQRPRNRIHGYEREVGGHLEVAAAIAAEQADTGLTIRVAAETYGLGFIPIRQERYDIAIAEREINSPPVKAMLDALNSSRFGREVALLCAYDTSAMGSVLASAA
ncbi:MAG TPA: substrate-binding domain-containing protein [Candidatus Binataceae bacterium]|nr:substrate-binding domain-containing protein [Candidatus Binataceae bacterium]